MLCFVFVFGSCACVDTRFNHASSSATSSSHLRVRRGAEDSAALLVVDAGDGRAVDEALEACRVFTFKKKGQVGWTCEKIVYGHIMGGAACR